jgi:hypothetical protein
MVVCWNVGIEVGMAFKSLYIRVSGEWKVRLESNTLNINIIYVVNEWATRKTGSYWAL